MVKRDPVGTAVTLAKAGVHRRPDEQCRARCRRWPDGIHTINAISDPIVVDGLRVE
jgi:hypothetical protein